MVLFYSELLLLLEISESGYLTFFLLVFQSGIVK